MWFEIYFWMFCVVSTVCVLLWFGVLQWTDQLLNKACTCIESTRTLVVVSKGKDTKIFMFKFGIYSIKYARNICHIISNYLFMLPKRIFYLIKVS